MRFASKLDEVNKKNKDDKEKLEKLWIQKTEIIINEIKSRTSNPFERLRLLFEYFTKDDMKYVLHNVTENGRKAIPDFYYLDGAGYTSGDKYSAVFNKEGLCASYSLAFENIANRLGIPCRVVIGNAGMDHAWNVVMIGKRVYHIDIAFALLYRSSKYNYFLADGFNRTYNCNYEKIIDEMSFQDLGISHYCETDLNKLELNFKVTQHEDSKKLFYSNRIIVYK